MRSTIIVLVAVDDRGGGLLWRCFTKVFSFSKSGILFEIGINFLVGL